jgi:hypothetical protein
MRIIPPLRGVGEAARRQITRIRPHQSPRGEVSHRPYGRLRGGRTWWAHFESTRLNVGPTMAENQIEDLIEILEIVRSSGAFRTDQ